MITIDVDFTPGRTLKPLERLIINGQEHVFRADVVKEKGVVCPVAIFTKPTGETITIINRPVYGLKFSEEIDLDIYWSDTSSWMIR